VFAGHPADFDQVDLGTLAAGEEREYLFSATLPDGGTDDNLYQGAGMSLGLEWQAGTASAPTPTPTATPTPTKPKPKPTPTPTKPRVTPTPAPTPIDYATALGLPPRSKCARKGTMKFKLKAPDGAKVISATVSVNGKIKARLRGKKVRKAVTLKRLKKTFTVSVTVIASNGRPYTGGRIYKVCKR
jgi:hypothetical protein